MHQLRQALHVPYVQSLPTGEQLKREFVATKGNGTHISLIRLLRSGMTVAQMERFAQSEIWAEYLRRKAKYVEEWDKVKSCLVW